MAVWIRLNFSSTFSKTPLNHSCCLVFDALTDGFLFFSFIQCRTAGVGSNFSNVDMFMCMYNTLHNIDDDDDALSESLILLYEPEWNDFAFNHVL